MAGALTFTRAYSSPDFASGEFIQALPNQAKSHGVNRKTRSSRSSGTRQ
jgi:hypothetical protein